MALLGAGQGPASGRQLMEALPGEMVLGMVPHVRAGGGGMEGKGAPEEGTA